jgi:hypothetical protein
MKLGMQITIADLIRALRWRGAELCEEAADRSKQIRREPETGNEREPVR